MFARLAGHCEEAPLIVVPRLTICTFHKCYGFSNCAGFPSPVHSQSYPLPKLSDSKVYSMLRLEGQGTHVETFVRFSTIGLLVLLFIKRSLNHDLGSSPLDMSPVELHARYL